MRYVCTQWIHVHLASLTHGHIKFCFFVTVDQVNTIKSHWLNSCVAVSFNTNQHCPAYSVFFSVASRNVWGLSYVEPSFWTTCKTSFRNPVWTLFLTSYPRCISTPLPIEFKKTNKNIYFLLNKMSMIHPVVYQWQFLDIKSTLLKWAIIYLLH